MFVISTKLKTRHKTWDTHLSTRGVGDTKYVRGHSILPPGLGIGIIIYHSI